MFLRFKSIVMQWALSFLLLSIAANLLPGQTGSPAPNVDPAKPSKEYIRTNGQAIAIVSSSGSGSPAPSTTSLLKGNGQGGIAAAVPGEDYQLPISTSNYLNGITSDVQSQLNTLNTQVASLVSRPSYNPAFPNSSTSTSSNIVVIGDSHMAGYGQSISIPSQIRPTESFTVANLAVSGAKFCAYWADGSAHESQVDGLYNPLARANILVVEGGLNDCIDNSTGIPAVPWVMPQTVYDCKVSYAKRRKSVGWTIVAFPAYSRAQVGINGQTGDQLHDQLNALEAAGWQSWADAYTPSGDPAAVFADGANNGSCFQPDHIHIANACTATLAGKLTSAINQAGYGTGRAGASSPGSNSTITNKLEISIGAAMEAIKVTSSVANDFAWQTFTNDSGKTFGLGTGGSASAQPNKFFIYNWAANSFPLTIDPSDVVHILKLDVGTCTGCSGMSGSSFNGGTITSKLEVALNTADMGISLKNSLANDFAWESFTNDSAKLFGIGVGGSASGQPNSFFIYNGANNTFPLTIDPNGQLKLSALAAPAGQKSFLCIDANGNVNSQATTCQ